MRDLEKAVEWLRPFVDSKAWDYCVVWKLGDDPSRYFIPGEEQKKKKTLTTLVFLLVLQYLVFNLFRHEQN